MLSIFMLARNVRKSAETCIQLLLLSVHKCGLESQVEYVIVDDASNPGQEVAPAMLALRERARSPVKVLHFHLRCSLSCDFVGPDSPRNLTASGGYSYRRQLRSTAISKEQRCALNPSS